MVNWGGVDFLTLDEVRARAGVNGRPVARNTVTAMVERGELPQPVRVGVRLLFVEVEVDAAFARMLTTRRVRVGAESERA